MTNLEKIANFLSQNPVQILSTSIKNFPNSRPLGSAMLVGDRIYYCMNKNKNLFLELSENSNVCICVCGKDFSWIRINASVIFDDDLEPKKAFIKNGKTRFQSPEDENFAVFYLSKIKAEIHRGLEIEKIEL